MRPRKYPYIHIFEGEYMTLTATTVWFIAWVLVDILFFLLVLFIVVDLLFHIQLPGWFHRHDWSPWFYGKIKKEGACQSRTCLKCPAVEYRGVHLTIHPHSYDTHPCHIEEVCYSCGYISREEVHDFTGENSNTCQKCGAENPLKDTNHEQN